MSEVTLESDGQSNTFRRHGGKDMRVALFTGQPRRRGRPVDNNDGLKALR